MEFNQEKSARAAAQAIESVTEAADIIWKTAAYEAVKYVAKTRNTFTTDDVWVELSIRGVAAPRELRAMVAPLQQAAKAGLIEKTESWKNSVIVECHSRPKRIWRSRS